MLFGSIISSPRDILLPTQALELANIYLENARKATDPYIALVLCHDTEVSLSQAKGASKRHELQVVREGVSTAYVKLGRLLDAHGRRDEAQACYRKGEKLGERVQEQREYFKALHRDEIQGNRQEHAQEVKHEPDSNTTDLSVKDPTDSMSTPNDEKPSHDPDLRQNKQGRDIARIHPTIFARNVRPPAMELKLPRADERLSTTPQLSACLSLLKHSQLLEDMLEPATRKWLRSVEKDSDEQERLKILATDVIRAFQREEIKDDKTVAEVVCLAPVLEKSDFQYLLRELCKGINQSVLLDVYQLDGITQLIQCADPGYLDADDLVKILELLSTRLRATHTQASQHIYQLTLAVSRVLDAMADTKVK
ncbi:hypothetical protein BGX34_003442, partial [Mortierella sp. NVP85]